ncbi:MAG: RidA family protein [Gemmatimonadota bacterium]|nr:RidA family protein [Gemmatimonadota bacterium]
MTFRVVNPEALGSPRGWNNGMLAPEGGRVLFVAGQIGVEGGATLAGQFEAALANVARVVEAAGGTAADVGRLTIYVTDMDTYRGSLAEIGAAYSAVFGKHFPAMALVAVTELVDSRAVVEIEATAVIPQACPDGVRAGRDTASEEQR